ncbi:MAG: prolyl-tRNA synthetase associated domain-containing protein [Bacteroidetes bacterium]|nr:prolyl-tRNA synthetase associated domain-containing protein [Bacteroidota bacterium]
MNGSIRLYEILRELDIPFDYYEHPAVATVEEARKYWKDLEATHCKNLFLRNHKGNGHYLVIAEYSMKVDIHHLEQCLQQGKLSFASDERLLRYLGVTPGSVTPFGLIYDADKHVIVYLDNNLQASDRISFHPCINTASIVLKFNDFLKYLKWTGNHYEFRQLSEQGIRG